eukprot:scaffold61_cov205-Alexandrium_tamarense.AAC.15
MRSDGDMRRGRIRMRPSFANAPSDAPSWSPAMRTSTTLRRRRTSQTAIAVCTILSIQSIDAFAPSLSSSCKHQLPLHPAPSVLHPRFPKPYNKNRSSTSLSAAAASAWLFTPERTSAILSDVVTDAALKSADVVLDAASYAASQAATVTTETVVRTIYKAPTVAAFVAAIYSIGKENTRRMKEVGGILWRRNWSVVALSLAVTRDVLIGREKLSGFKNRFPAALQTLKDGFAEVRRVFTESVDAIKKETQMYSAAVGLPGLIPIQYIFDRIFPSTLTAPFESALEDALQQTARDNTQIRKLILKKFSMGEKAPRILEARLFDLGDKDMAFDLEILWKSDARADLKMKVAGWGTEIPVTISNLRFEGPVRLIVVGLRPEEPGWEAMLISLPRPPQIGFDLKVAGGLITQIPWLRNELAKMLDDAVAAEVLWPRRAVVSAPSPFKAKPLLNPMQMLTLMRDDPLLRRERELMESIPDDFRSTYEASSQEDIPDFVIREVSEKTEGGDNDDDEGGEIGNARSAVPRMRQRLRFWQRNKQAVASEATADTLQRIAQSLSQENVAVARVRVVEGVEEKKGMFQRMMSNVFLPRSLMSYASKEAF